MSETPSNASLRDRAFFGHPAGLSTLFFTEMWERFSYYGMRAILTLFMVAPVAAGGLGMKPEQSGPIYAMYTSLVYLMSIPGGWIADNILGQRRSVFYGGIVIMVGHILLAMHGIGFFYAGLGCVILGTGLLKPNISAIVGQLYKSDDDRRDSGFSIFYMGINIGAFLAPLICGALAQAEPFKGWLESVGLDPRNSWHWGFGAAAVGMFFGLVQYVLTGKNMGSAGQEPAPPQGAADMPKRRKTLWIGVSLFVAVGAIIALVGVMRPGALNTDSIDLGYRVVLFLVVVLFFGNLFLKGQWTAAERGRLWVIAILFMAAAVFWGVFEQAGSTLTIFADYSTENSVLGYGFASSWWQSANAVFIVLLAPLFSWLWLSLAKRHRDLSYGTKFGLGLVFVGAGFLWLVGGGKLFSDDWDDYVAKNRAAIIEAGHLYGGIGEDQVRSIRDAGAAAGDSAVLPPIDDAAKSDWAAYVDTNRDRIVDAAGRFDIELIPATGDIPVSQVNEIVVNAADAGVEDVLPPWNRVGISWLFGVYLLHTIGELCLSPVGLSAMTKLAPARVVGQMMGVWFLAASIGNYMGGTIAGYYEKFKLPVLLTFVAGGAFVMAVVMFLLVKPINRMLALSDSDPPDRDTS